MDPIVCKSCGARFPIKSLSEDDWRQLDDQHDYEEMAEELKMLRNVQAFYHRHPEAEGNIRPDLNRLLESDDPEVREQLCEGTPFDQIALRPPELPGNWVASDEDRQVVQYLRTCSFSLGPRLGFVAERVASLRETMGKVSCAQCGVGSLHLPIEGRAEFNARDSVTWYWPHWYHFEVDGTLSIKISIYQHFGHGTGEMQMKPGNAEYAFWSWLVEQKAYHRPVQDSELPGIREEWSRREKSGA